MHKRWLLAAALAASLTGSHVASADCAADADRIGKRLAGFKTTAPGFMPVIKSIGLPTAANAKTIDQRGFVFAITKDGKLFVQGQALAQLKEAEQLLDTMWKSALEAWVMEGGSGKDAKFAVYIWADKDTPAKHVAALVAAAAKVSDRFQVRLLVAGKGSAIAPPKGALAVAGKVPGGEPEGTKYIAAELKKAIGGCAPLITALSISSSIDRSTSKKHDLADGVPKAMRDCSCKVANMDVFEWGIVEWYGATGSTFAWVDMPKLGATDAQPLGKLVK